MPGETLAGALAASWLRDVAPGTDPGRMFESTFRHGRFGPMSLRGANQEPLSVTGCKYRPNPDCGETSVRDEAWPQVPDTGAQATALTDWTDRLCPSCGRTVARSKGRIQLGEDLVVTTHVELTTDETAKDGNLFRRESLRPTTLRGVAWLPVALPTQLAGRTQIRVGAARSTRGAASVTFTPEPSPHLSAQSLERLATRKQIVIRLLSPAVLVDGFGRPALTREAWQDELVRAFPAHRPTVSRAWVRWDEVGGWSGSSNLPKPTERVMSAGSVLEVTFETSPSAEQVAAFRDTGLGLRTNQGYGWIDVDPWVQTPTRAVAAGPGTPTEAGALSALKALSVDRTVSGSLLGVVREIVRAGSLDLADVVGALSARDWFRRAPSDLRSTITTCLPQLSAAQLRELEGHLDDVRRGQRAGTL